MPSPLDSPGSRRVLPGTYPLWDRALALLNRDLAATLPEQEPLQLLAAPPRGTREPENFYVALGNGAWHGNHLSPTATDEPSSVLETVADAAQETVTECLWQAWPLCGEHGLGMHPREVEGQLSWWCAGKPSLRVPAHVRAAVGALDTCERPRRTARKGRRAR
ncbi:hypothetical protein ACQPZG_03245 (plasmid) [Streptomyces sp. CA-294286]|uniref:hypothetical protein n=1 Tax=Streptomyces sp. CA-294286 TaxID=3240070 RepID=UPI003D9173F0